jgi:hypothetical protein
VHAALDDIGASNPIAILCVHHHASPAHKRLLAALHAEEFVWPGGVHADTPVEGRNLAVLAAQIPGLAGGAVGGVAGVIRRSRRGSERVEMASRARAIVVRVELSLVDVVREGTAGTIQDGDVHHYTCALGGWGETGCGEVDEPTDGRAEVGREAGPW